MNTEQPPQKSADILKHPLTVLLVGTLLGSILIPLGSNFLATQRIRREARQDLVRRVLEYDTMTRQALLSLHTRLNLFDDKMQSFHPNTTVLLAEQGKLYESAVKQYLAFDNSLWTTPEQIVNELRLRRLAPEESIVAIKGYFSEYHHYVWSARDSLMILWTACVNSDYSPGDPNIQKLIVDAKDYRNTLENEGVALILKAAHKIQEQVW